MAKLKEEIIYHECLQGNIRDVMEWRKYRELEIYLRYTFYILLFFFFSGIYIVVGDISFTDLTPPQIRCCPKPGPVFSTPYVDS